MIYTVEQLNEKIAGMAYVYRIIKEVEETDRDADWLGRAGLFHLADCCGAVWVDSFLDRYIVLTNGQCFVCTNTDLTTKTAGEQTNIRAILSGLID